MGDGGLAGFGAELEARAAPAALARIAELDVLSITGTEQKAAAALEYFRVEWLGYFAVPADAPPIWDTVSVSPEGFEQASASITEAALRWPVPDLDQAVTRRVFRT